MYYYKRLSGIAISPACTLFSCRCYLLASGQRNKHCPQIVATLKLTANKILAVASDRRITEPTFIQSVVRSAACSQIWMTTKVDINMK